jgi:UDP-glucose 4-epimerase
MPVILLTGAAGYIGSHTWVLLEQAGFQVVGVDDHRNSSPRVLDRLARLLGHAPEFERADVCDSAAMADVLGRHQVDAAVHFAALKSVGESVSDPLTYYANNIGGLVSTCEAPCVRRGCADSSSAAAPRCTARPSASPSPRTRRSAP